jgi:hypothetical protein
MTIGYHINAKARTIEPVTYNSYKDIQKILECETFAQAGYVAGTDNLLLVDDNGLYKPATDFWQLAGSFQPVPHGALLVGPDKIDAKGNERPSDPTMSIEALRSLAEWKSRAEYEAWIDAHFDQAAISVNGVCIQTWGDVYASMPKP